MSIKDYYGILGVDKTASSEEIKNSFRTLARKYHPDTSDEPDAEEKFKEINEAYEILRDPDKRRQYDNPTHNFGMGDLFSDFFGGMRGFRRTRPAADVPRRGQDAKFTLGLHLGEAIFGAKRKFSYTYKTHCSECNGKGGTDYEPCANCQGRGSITDTRIDGNSTFVQTIPCRACRGAGGIPTKNCESCGGSGSEERQKEVLVEIPAGARNGTILTYHGKGLEGKNGGPPGDLHFIMEVRYPNLDEMSEEDREMLRKILWGKDEKME